ncbi:hypothetical protein F4810DRAFT_718569 [Camillea tinctor]|nr:hypothetical protein F4810DRAFT_718569 [Camillea tinctor]
MEKIPAFGSIQIHIVRDAGEDLQSFNYSGEEAFLRDATNKAIMVITLEEVQNEITVVLKKFLEERDFEDFSAGIVDDFIFDLLTKKVIICCETLADPRQLFIACPRWMETQDTPLGNIIFNKSIIIPFSQHYYRSIRRRTRGKCQLFMVTSSALIHGWAQILAYNAAVNAQLSRVYGPIRPILVQKYLSGPDMNIDYLQFAGNLINNIFGGQPRFYQVHDPPNPAGWMMIRVGSSSDDKGKPFKISESSMKKLIIEGSKYLLFHTLWGSHDMSPLSKVGGADNAKVLI